MKKVTIITLAVTLLAACSKDSIEVNPGSSAQNNSTPNSEKTFVTRSFNATINAVADTDPSIPPTPCSQVVPIAAPDFLLSGSGIHIGQIDAEFSRLHHSLCDLNTTTALLSTSVEGQLAAANGDLIFYEGDDVVNVAALFTPGGGTTGTITGTWTITGGTGRFEGATGSLTINGVVDLVAFSFTCQCVGTITY